VIREEGPVPWNTWQGLYPPLRRKMPQRRSERAYLHLRPEKICLQNGERGFWKKTSKIAPDTGKKVAVIGSGPAGLTVAFYLRNEGTM